VKAVSSTKGGDKPLPYDSESAHSGGMYVYDLRT